MQVKIYQHPAITYFVIAAITILVYWNIYHIPFLYNETGLLKQPIIQDLGVFFDKIYTLNWKALVARPFSNFTFAINYAIGGDNPAGYHLFNLVLHLINILLVFILAKRFFKFPAFTATFFALHPLGTACVSQIFGRAYSLATLFMLLGLYVYLSAWQQQRLDIKKITVLFLLFICMLLSKQTLVFFPFILIWHMICFPRLLSTTQFRILFTARYLILGAIIISVVIFFCIFYAAPMSDNAVVNSKTFMISQLGNIHNLLSFYFLPFQNAIRHDLPFYEHINSPNVVFGILFLITYITLAIRLRHTNIGFLMGAILIALLPTNTIFPKDEVILEWRLYPSLPFFALMMGCIVYLIYTQLAVGMKKYFPVAVGIGGIAIVSYLSSFSMTIWAQNKIYNHNFSAWHHALSIYPYSAYMHNNLGVFYYSQANHLLAQYYFKKAAEMEPLNAVFTLNVAMAHKALGQSAPYETFSQKGLELKKQYGLNPMSVYINDTPLF